jgi:hypothetical protein
VLFVIEATSCLCAQKFAEKFVQKYTSDLRQSLIEDAYLHNLATLINSCTCPALCTTLARGACFQRWQADIPTACYIAAVPVGVTDMPAQNDFPDYNCNKAAKRLGNDWRGELLNSYRISVSDFDHFGSCSPVVAVGVVVDPARFQDDCTLTGTVVAAVVDHLMLHPLRQRRRWLVAVLGRWNLLLSTCR